jgi:hypothetical protein
MYTEKAEYMVVSTKYLLVKFKKVAASVYFILEGPKHSTTITVGQVVTERNIRIREVMNFDVVCFYRQPLPKTFPLNSSTT